MHRPEATPEEKLQRDLDAANLRIRQLQQQMELLKARAAFFLKYDQMPPTDREVK